MHLHCAMLESIPPRLHFPTDVNLQERERLDSDESDNSEPHMTSNFLLGVENDKEEVRQGVLDISFLLGIVKSWACAWHADMFLKSTYLQ